MEFEPTTSASKRPQTYALDRAATETDGDNIKVDFKGIGRGGIDWSLTTASNQWRTFVNMAMQNVLGLFHHTKAQ